MRISYSFLVRTLQPCEIGLTATGEGTGAHGCKLRAQGHTGNTWHDQDPDSRSMVFMSGSRFPFVLPEHSLSPRKEAE